jgi:D-sedoheptulose 7-phosphate isomerase
MSSKIVNMDLLTNNSQNLTKLLIGIDPDYSGLIYELGLKISLSLKANSSIFWCGNGGSAAESQHMAAELMGRFLINRKPYRSLSLTTDTSAITGISNDFHFNEIFSRQLEGMARPGDYLVVFTTSGNSQNILLALEKAKEIGVHSIAFLGKGGGKVKNLADTEFFVDATETARIQEVHTVMAHTLCQIIEAECEK